MLATQAFYAAFQRAGFLVQCTRPPLVVGEPVQNVWVRYREITSEVFDGLALQNEPTLKLPAGAFPGLAEGHPLTIAHVGGPRHFTVREVHLINEGREQLVLLRPARAVAG